MCGEIEAVLFDLDHTLCKHHQSGAQALTLAFEREGVEPFFTIEEYRNRYTELVEKADVTEMTDITAILRADCFASIAADHGRDPALGRSIAAAYAEERDYRDVYPLPGTRATLESLSQDHQMGIVTNGPPKTQATKIDALGIGDIFDIVINAGFDAAVKPDPEPFQLAVSELGVSSDTTAHVGDSIDHDVAGAQAAGLTAVWISDNTDPEPIPDYTIDSISELKEPLWC